MAKAERHHALVVPTCTVCGNAVTAHFDQRGRWAGCRPMLAQPDARYVLIPDRRYVPPVAAVQNLQSGVANDYTGHANVGTEFHSALRRSVIPAAQERRQSQRTHHTRTSRTLYVANYGIRDAKAKAIDSDRDKEVLAVIARARTGISRPDLLKEMKAGTRTGIVDGAVRRLRLRRAIVSKVLED